MAVNSYYTPYSQPLTGPNNSNTPETGKENNSAPRSQGHMHFEKRHIEQCIIAHEQKITVNFDAADQMGNYAVYSATDNSITY